MVSPQWMKKSGLSAAHRLVDLHAAEVGVDAVALARGVARPDEAHVARVGRRGAKVARHRLGQRTAGEVFPHHAVEDVLAGRQPGQVDARAEVGAFLAHTARARVARWRSPMSSPTAPTCGPADRCAPTRCRGRRARHRFARPMETPARALGSDHRGRLRMGQDRSQPTGARGRTGEQDAAAGQDDSGHGGQPPGDGMALMLDAACVSALTERPSALARPLGAGGIGRCGRAFDGRLRQLEEDVGVVHARR